MARRKESLLDDLGRLPWWVSVALAAIFFAFLRWVVPWVFADDGYSESGSLASSMFAPLATMVVPSFAPFVAVLLLVPAAVSAIRQWKNSKLLDSQGGLAEIKQLDWSQFERLVGDYYRRTGYRVQPTADGPDGGVDLRLNSDLGLYLVQCKHWRRDVGVKIVRELYGVMTAEDAYGGAVWTTGSFSPKAQSFANGTPIELVDGPKLAALIKAVQRRESATSRIPDQASSG
ncbi:MAG: restriction endonuclease [Gammaproteobacteria bacterium]|nr:restriction endonuclease [Gammaproteobacteria bacterium]